MVARIGRMISNGRRPCLSAKFWTYDEERKAKIFISALV
jgi:hypothetical protein